MSPRPDGPVPVAGAVSGPELLERAVGYTRATLPLVVTADLSARTPCAGWDLRDLLRHLDDSLAALTEAAEVGHVALSTRPDRCPSETARLVARLRGRACALLAAWSAPSLRAVSVSGRTLPPDLLAAVGALELAVHGWDVAQACGGPHPLPPDLARDLLAWVPLLVDEADRPRRFADVVDVPPRSGPAPLLLAALGRRVP